MTGRAGMVAVDTIDATPREVVLTPDAAARQALATRLNLPEIPALVCSFRLRLDRGGRVLAACELTGRIVQIDVATLEPFETTLHEQAALRFVPEATLTDAIDPGDPVDEVGYTGRLLDLDEAMAQQLALVLDPYPRAP